jgi:hypothetical protein
MSDVTLADRLEPVRYDAMASYKQPFTIGTFHVVPRIGTRIETGEDLTVFYEVYGGRRPYRVTYQLEARRDEGWVPASRPIVQEGGQGAQGWSVPIPEAWPAGKYRLQIKVEDEQGLARTAAVDFELVPPAAS